MRFYNSRTKEIENFDHDISEPVNIYTCGPTVYDRVHLGNLKTFLWSDFIVGYLKTLGFKTNHIINITDIDDKIISRLPEQTYESLIKYTQHYTDCFIEDIHAIGIRYYTKENIHKITDNVDSMEQMVIELIDKGYAYETSDGCVYFDSTKIKDNPFYVETDTEGYENTRGIIRSVDVRNNKDFVLWKVKSDEPIKWGTKLKPGRISWMPECACLSLKLLGKVHIGMGGQDLQYSHHCCTIAQAEALNPNEKYGDYWIHFGFLNFAGDKMSKSIGNIKRLDDVKYNRKLLRMYLLSKSYRNDFDYNESEIEMMKKDFINLHLLVNKLKNRFYRPPKEVTNGQPLKEVTYGQPPKEVTEGRPLKHNQIPEINIYDNIIEILSNNLDTHKAFMTLFEYVGKVMKVYMTDEYAKSVLTSLYRINEIFNILDDGLFDIDGDTMKIIELREEYRKQKRFDLTDSMREDIKVRYIFEDDNTGFSLIKKFD